MWNSYIVHLWTFLFTVTISAEIVLKYHNYEEMTTKLQNLVAKYPDLLSLYQLDGTSIQGRKLWVVKIATEKKRPDLKPMVKYLANMHGNEAVGKELMIGLVEYLAETYKNGSNPEITQLVSTMDIHLMPSMNPDGFENSSIGFCSHSPTGRHNMNDVDLNRNFPTWDDQNFTDVNQLYNNREPETRAVMKWIMENPFVLSINFHDGAIVANYPWDDSDAPSGQPSLTDDDELFKDLARTYAGNHEYMHKGSGICHSDSFPEGITNGAQWYVVAGGMQDFNYLFSNCFEITVEVSCCKYPLVEDLVPQWNANKNSLIKYLKKVHQGIKGHVLDKKGEVIPNAKVIVEGINKPVTTTATGEYWRLLRPGQYKIKAQDNSGHYSDFQTISITSDSEVQIVDFTLDKEQGHSENQGAETCFVESKIILSCLLIQYVYPIFY